MTARPRVALSAGGDKKELAPLGLGMEHVEELLVRMARRLLAEGHLLAFGGTLNKPDEALTELLIDAALGWMHEQKAHDVDPPRTRDLAAGQRFGVALPHQAR